MIHTKAEKMLYSNFLLNVDIIECLRREGVEILFDSEDGILILDKESQIYMVSTENRENIKKIIELIPVKPVGVLAHQEFYCEELKNKCKLDRVMETYHSVWEKDELVKVPEFKGEIKRLTMEEFNTVIENYSSLDVVDKNNVENKIKKGNMIGAFIDNNLCGFIGYHDEGSIGLLEVLPKYRKEGIGSVLQATAVNEALKNGQIPYGEVKEENYKSLNLQAKLGFSVSKDKIYWIL